MQFCYALQSFGHVNYDNVCDPRQKKECVVSRNVPIFFLKGRLVGKHFFGTNSLRRKSMIIIKNTLKIEEKFSDVPQNIGVGSVGFPELFTTAILAYFLCFMA